MKGCAWDHSVTGGKTILALPIREGPIPQILLEETGSHNHPSSKGGRKGSVQFSAIYRRAGIGSSAVIGMQQAALSVSSELFIYWTFNECERLGNAGCSG